MQSAHLTLAATRVQVAPDAPSVKPQRARCETRSYRGEQCKFLAFNLYEGRRICTLHYREAQARVIRAEALKRDSIAFNRELANERRRLHAKQVREARRVAQREQREQQFSAQRDEQ